jgi:hypothetical protein
MAAVARAARRTSISGQRSKVDRIVWSVRHKHPDAPTLLRGCRERPRGRGAAEKRG